MALITGISVVTGNNIHDIAINMPISCFALYSYRFNP